MKTGLDHVVNKGDVLRQREKIIQKKCHRRRKLYMQAISTPVQLLFNTCREVFNGPGTIPPPHDIEKLRLILDNTKPEDLGLSKDLLFFKANDIIQGTPRITYTTIYKCNNFSLCMFFLPPTAVIPLHNHPDMTVFSKLLLGKMHIRAYDWASQQDDPMQVSRLRLARLKIDSTFTAPCSSSVLFPTAGGNIHTFTAVTPCAVLDVMGPPYAKEDGRDCSYYREINYPVFDCQSLTDNVTKRRDTHLYRWLEEIGVPEDLKMEGVEYLGPQILEQ